MASRAGILMDAPFRDDFSGQGCAVNAVAGYWGIHLRRYKAPMKLASWNVNSIRQRLAHVVDWLNAHEPDVLALQELKTEAHIPAGRDRGHRLPVRAGRPEGLQRRGAALAG